MEMPTIAAAGAFVGQGRMTSGWGDYIARARKAAGLSQEQLAQAAGLSMWSVSQIETGRIKQPREATLRALAEALGVRYLDMMVAAVGEDEAGDDDPGDPRLDRIQAMVRSLDGHGLAALDLYLSHLLKTNRGRVD